MHQTFVPDYSVRAISDVLYVAIKRTLYLAAKRATLMEKSKRFGGELGSNEPIDYEVEKVNNFSSSFLILWICCNKNGFLFQLLHSLDEDDRSISAHTANLNAVSPRASKSTSPTAVNVVSPRKNIGYPKENSLICFFFYKKCLISACLVFF